MHIEEQFRKEISAQSKLVELYKVNMYVLMYIILILILIILCRTRVRRQKNVSKN